MITTKRELHLKHYLMTVMDYLRARFQNAINAPRRGRFNLRMSGPEYRNKVDELGPIYAGVQWMKTAEQPRSGTKIEREDVQIFTVFGAERKSAESRARARVIVSGMNVGLIPQRTAPCHAVFQFLCSEGKLVIAVISTKC